MVFKRKRIHRAVCKFLVLQSCRIETVIFAVILQKFLYIYKHSGIYKLLTVRISIYIYDIRHITTGNQCLEFLQIRWSVCGCLKFYLPFSAHFLTVFIRNFMHCLIYSSVNRSRCKPFYCGYFIIISGFCRRGCGSLFYGTTSPVVICVSATIVCIAAPGHQSNSHTCRKQQTHNFFTHITLSFSLYNKQDLLHPELHIFPHILLCGHTFLLKVLFHH